MGELWRIERLCELAARALADPGYGPASARVREVPDVRTIRYYTTLGLLDRPAEMRGRTAYYHRKHLLQLVALKKLQAKGLSLVEVQAALAGASAKKLANWANLPPGLFENGNGGEQPAEARHNAATQSFEQEKSRRQFWSQAVELPSQSEPAASRALPHRAAVILPVMEGVSLLLEGPAVALADAHAAALRPALEALRESIVRVGQVRE